MHHFDGRLMGGLPGAPERGPGGGVELEDIGRLTELFPSGPGATFGAARDDGRCPSNCCWGNFQDWPQWPWWRSYPWHSGAYRGYLWLMLVVGCKLLRVMLNGEW
jgi:hypothetical protein